MREIENVLVSPYLPKDIQIRSVWVSRYSTMQYDIMLINLQDDVKTCCLVLVTISLTKFIKF